MSAIQQGQESPTIDKIAGFYGIGHGLLSLDEAITELENDVGRLSQEDKAQVGYSMYIASFRDSDIPVTRAKHIGYLMWGAGQPLTRDEMDSIINIAKTA